MRGMGNLNIVYCILLYFIISRNYQNNWTNNGNRPSFVLFFKLETISPSFVFKALNAFRMNIGELSSMYLFKKHLKGHLMSLAAPSRTNPWKIRFTQL